MSTNYLCSNNNDDDDEERGGVREEPESAEGESAKPV